MNANAEIDIKLVEQIENHLQYDELTAAETIFCLQCTQKLKKIFQKSLDRQE